MTQMQFFAGAMKKALGYVAKRSKSSHIHSVQWTEASGGYGFDRLQVEIETTDFDGRADYRWQVQVFKYESQKTFEVEEHSVDVCELY